MKYFSVILEEPELHTILAALQVYQTQGEYGRLSPDILEIATNGGDSIRLFEDELLDLREKINLADEQTAEDFRLRERLAHAEKTEKEAIAFAHVLAQGKDLLHREIDLLKEKVRQYEGELGRVEQFLRAFEKNTGSVVGCQHGDHEDHLICQGCGECREDLDEDDFCTDCNTRRCACGYETDDDDDMEAHIQGCSLTGVEGGL